MNGADSFFDTNILLYLLSKDAAKADRAEALLASGGVVSVQVLNEFASVASRKLAMTITEIREILSTIRPLSTQRQNFFSAVSSRCWYRQSAVIEISTHLPPPVMMESTAALALV